MCELLAFVEMYRWMLERNPWEILEKKKKVCTSVVFSRGSEELGCSSELPIKFTILRPAAGDAPQIQAASRREERLPLVACAPRVAVSAAAGGVWAQRSAVHWAVCAQKKKTGASFFFFFFPLSHFKQLDIVQLYSFHFSMHGQCFSVLLIKMDGN